MGIYLPALAFRQNEIFGYIGVHSPPLLLQASRKSGGTQGTSGLFGGFETICDTNRGLRFLWGSTRRTRSSRHRSEAAPRSKGSLVVQIHSKPGKKGGTLTTIARRDTMSRSSGNVQEKRRRQLQALCSQNKLISNCL